MKNCNDCGVGVMPRTQWQALSAEEREAHRSRGINRKASRGLCVTCYMRLRDRGQLPVVQLEAVPVEVVAEEWNWLANPWWSDRINAEALAPRLGMTVNGLEKSVQRARKLGLVAAPNEYAA